MAWFEAHQELVRHRKTKALARLLDIGRPQAVGHLFFLWAWAMDHAPDGDLTSFEDADIAEECGWCGTADAFTAALTAAGFLDADRRIHDWDEYAGRLIEKREAARQRAREHRVRAPSTQRTHTVRAAYAPTEQNTTQQNTTEPSTKPTAAKLRYTARFEEFWAVYPAKLDKGHAATAFADALKRAPFEDIIAGARRYRDDPNRGKTKWAQGWLNGDRWLDEPLPAQSSNGNGHADRLGASIRSDLARAAELQAGLN